MNALHKVLLQHPHTLSSLSQQLGETQENIQKNLNLLLEMKRVKQKSFKTSCKRDNVRIFYKTHANPCEEVTLINTPVQFHSNSTVLETSESCNPPIPRNSDLTPCIVKELSVKSNCLPITQTSKTCVPVIKTLQQPQSENTQIMNSRIFPESHSSAVHEPKPTAKTSKGNIFPSKSSRRRKFVLPRFTGSQHKAPALHSCKIRKTNSFKRFKPPRMQPIKKRMKEETKSKNKDSDPVQLRRQIKKWTEACQDALTALVKEVPERNLTLKQLIDKFGIPAEKVLYDHESEEFGNVEANLDRLLVLRLDS